MPQETELVKPPDLKVRCWGAVHRSVKEHGFTANAGIGPDPSEGESYWR
jgi:hypothetical protein